MNALRGLVLAALLLVACAPAERAPTVITISASGVGKEGKLLSRQLDRFMQLHPGVRVVRETTPDDAEVRHRGYVQRLVAGLHQPDVLQLDVIWTPELAAAGWLLPLEAPDAQDFVKPALDAQRHQGQLYALPWFVDVGMLYYRKDRGPPPTSLADLERGGLAWQNARYEGLVTVFQEVLGAFGGRMKDDQGHVVVDSPQGDKALSFMRSAITRGSVPRAALSWHEEETRFAFENGRVRFMRNWPYAASLLTVPFGVMPLPAAPGGQPTAALGGAALAVNAASEHPREARALIEYLTAPEQMLERARIAGQLPARLSVYRSPELELAISPADALRIVRSARARPASPIYSELSELLQIHLHDALSGRAEPHAALSAAAREMNARIERKPPRETSRAPWIVAFGLLALGLGLLFLRRRPRPEPDDRLGWLLTAPALGVVLLVVGVPLALTVWESLHAHRLAMPWQGRPFVGARNYAELFGDPRVRGALVRTLGFVGVSVALELAFGFALALGMKRALRGRLSRALALAPWAMPTVVVGLGFRFLFDDQSGIARAVATGWLSSPTLAWVPLVSADVWKTTPFVALLLLAGLSAIDERLYEAAALDGAGVWQRFWYLTLPLVRPALLVALVFRTLDAFRIFDLALVLTGGGPGTATEPVALLAYTSLFSHLRFGYGSALGVVMFAVTLALAWAYVHLLERAQ
ncbi:MAG: extracellular solute-binding protein [Myxococcales bacterium]|nr:extracellular solute-binding protein [Myxococcales bacterium]